MIKIDYNLKISIIFMTLVFIFLLSGCNKQSMVYENDIFTEDTYKNLIEIDYWLGDTKLVIDNKDDMKCIYESLSTLQLREAPITDAIKMGHIGMDLVTDDETISVGLLSGEISVGGNRYYTDKDVVDYIREIALKYMNYYNNDIFTKELYESLIEIDCWVDGEKFVIDDKDKLEEAYHYLSLLTLEEASPDYKVRREPLQIDVVTADATLSYGILSNVLCTDDTVYYTDSKRDMVQLISMLAEEN